MPLIAVLHRSALRLAALALPLVLLAASAEAQQQRSTSPQRQRSTTPAAQASGQERPASAAQERSGSRSSRSSAKSTGATPVSGQAVESFGDWRVYAAGNGRSKVCYALAEAKSRSPANLKDVKGFLFIATRPAEKVSNELSLVMNFDLKEGVDHQAVVGKDQFALVAKGQNLWTKNPAEEGRIVEAMKRAGELTIKGTSARNNPTSDRYSLKGFGKAIDKAREECR
jgi:hypothetical protein